MCHRVVDPCAKCCRPYRGVRVAGLGSVVATYGVRGGCGRGLEMRKIFLGTPQHRISKSPRVPSPQPKRTHRQVHRCEFWGSSAGIAPPPPPSRGSDTWSLVPAFQDWGSRKKKKNMMRSGQGEYSTHSRTLPCTVLARSFPKRGSSRGEHRPHRHPPLLISREPAPWSELARDAYLFIYFFFAWLRSEQNANAKCVTLLPYF